MSGGEGVDIDLYADDIEQDFNAVCVKAFCYFTLGLT